MHATLGGYGDVPLQLTFVFTKCSYILHRSLGHDLKILLASFVGPWMVGGHFNMVQYIDECFGSTPHALPSWEFSDIIMDYDLHDLVFSFFGSSYTWCGSSLPLLWKRLDQVIINSEWYNSFLIDKLEHLSKESSDHLPLLFTFNHDSACPLGGFRFQNMWLNHPNFRNVFMNSWEHRMWVMVCMFGWLSLSSSKLLFGLGIKMFLAI